MSGEARGGWLREVRARRWRGEQLGQALARCGWTAGALTRVRSIGGRSGQRSKGVDERSKPVKRWLTDKRDVDPAQQEWLERVMAVVAAGPSLFDGPPGPMTAARFREVAWLLEWDVLVWKEGVARGNTFTPFGDVFGIPQAEVQAMARGEKPVPLALGNALESIMDGVRGHEGRSEEDGDGRNGADQRTGG